MLAQNKLVHKNLNTESVLVKEKRTERNPKDALKNRQENFEQANQSK